MTFRELTELQEMSRNAAHMSAIKDKAETNGWDKVDESRRWIAAGYGSRPNMDEQQEKDPVWRWIVAGYGSRLHMD
jgi:hypothetical protein